jgi:hypothetical protein
VGVILRRDWFWCVRDRDDGFRLHPDELKILLETPGPRGPAEIMPLLRGWCFG